MKTIIHSREEALEKIIEVYSRWYTIHNDKTTASEMVECSDASEKQIALVQSGRLDEEEGAFVMTRKVMVWEAQSHEHVYFFCAKHLTLEALEEVLKESYEKGMAVIEPGPIHRCSFIASLIVAESADKEAINLISKFRKKEEFKMSLHGWMCQFVGLVLPDEFIVCPGNKRMEEFLEYALDLEGYRKRRRGIRGFIRKIFK